MLALVARVDVPDDLLAPVGLTIDVDVGDDPALITQQVLEDQIVGQGIDRADAQQIGHQGVGRRAAPLAGNALLAGEARPVPDQQKVVRQVGALDHAQLVGQLLPDPRGRRRIARQAGRLAALAQTSGCSEAGGRGKPGQILEAEAQLERAGLGDLPGGGQRLCGRPGDGLATGRAPPGS